MLISVVTTLYYSEAYIQEFYERIVKVLQTITEDYEIIFVNDGSPDNSMRKVLDLYEKDDRVVLADLSRNFGHHRAIMTGLHLTRSDYIFLIDIDLEEDPELLQSFWEEYHKEKEIDVVFGVQQKRKGAWFERISGKWFYRLFRMIADVDYPADMLSARLMSKKYVESVKQYTEKELELWGIFVLSGFNQKAISVKKGYKGSSTYTFRKKVKIALESITSFSSKPLLLIFVAGFFITMLGIVYAAILILQKIWYDSIEGWTAIMVSLYFLNGIIILSLGVIGIYISKIFLEVKNRPLTVIKRIYKKK